MQRPCPIPPLPEDCCGQGCKPCVNDIYEEELKLWEKETSDNSDAIDQIQDDILSNGETTQVIRCDGYTRFAIQDILPVTTDTFIYRFALPFRSCRLLPNPTDVGKHLILRLNDIVTPMKGETKCITGSITRQYTILTDPSIQGYFELMIKLYKDGRASQVIRQWKIGDFAEFRGPFGELQVFLVL